MIRTIAPALVSMTLMAAPLLESALAASGDLLSEGYGSIIVEQENKSGIIGSWTMLMPGNLQETYGEKTHSFPSVPAGKYTIFAEPPDGATAKIRIYKENDLIADIPRPQVSFDLENGTILRIVVEHKFTRIGIVAVNSDPAGLAFRLSGPNESSFTGITPASFTDAPEGQYTVQFDPIEGCVTPKPKSHRLLAGSRISLDVSMECEILSRRMMFQERDRKRYVTAFVEGKEITFFDVPQHLWFAVHVYTALRTGILSGYKNAKGEPMGEYRPDNLVTVAELAKIAHRLAGFEVAPAADGPWHAPYIESAEERGWTIFLQETIEPEREASRGEVIVTLLQALDVPVRWQKGNVFTDVSLQTPHAAAIETAAGDGIVSGRTDAEGNVTGLFEPSAPVNRAEMAKIIDLAIAKYKGERE